MAASHHDREEETLISYFQQMLAEVDDQEFDGEIQATTGLVAPAPAPMPLTSTQSVLAAANAAIAQSQHFEPQPVAQVTPPLPAAPQPQVAVPPQVVGVAQVVPPQAQPEPDSDNPFAGMPRLTTQELLAQEMVMLEEPEEQPSTIEVAAPSEPQTLHTSRASESYSPRYEPEAEPSYHTPAYEPEPQVQTLPGSAPESAPGRDFAQPDEQLQHLLDKIDTSTAVKTEEAAPEVVVAEAEPEVAVAEAEPEVAVAEAEPEVAVAVAEAEPEVAVAAAEPMVAVQPEVAPVVAPVVTTTKQKILTPQELAQERMREKLRAIAAEWKNVDLGEQFQVLFFLVQGVRFAVPLIDLGGIFECDKITQLFGKPSWFMGITDIRGSKINIVDTLRWVMPEIGDSPDKYPYLIALGKSQWSIGCDVLEGNRTLTSSQVKWREIPGNRPWLAGIVTSEKCALLHVSALIALFEAGADIDDLNREAEASSKHKQR